MIVQIDDDLIMTYFVDSSPRPGSTGIEATFAEAERWRVAMELYRQVQFEMEQAWKTRPTVRVPEVSQ